MALETTTGLGARKAFRFALMFGFVNLFADMTYESARSITGPFLGSLGASAVVVGFVAGFGELIGYGLRSLTGFIGDRTGRYWAVTLCGYGINLLAVPALALAGNWPMAAALMIVERTGRAIRKPAVEAMLSFAGKHMGQGWVFGLNEALDQTGATLGPLVVAWVLYTHGGYRHAFALLLVPALCTLSVLVVARYFFPHPAQLEAGRVLRTEGLPRAYWIYLAAGACLAAGFADFALIAFHFQQARVIPEALTPVYYALAMATGAIAALAFGRLYDRLGLAVVLGAFAVSSLFAPLVFLGDGTWAGVGMVVWGLGLGAQESLLKPLIAGLVAAGKRGTAFGVFDAGYGVAWFLGSALMGVLYAKSILGLVIFSMVAQWAALPVLVAGRRRDLELRS
jgi:MFS family permease